MDTLQGKLNYVGAAIHNNTTKALGVVTSTDALARELSQKLTHNLK